MRRIIGVTLLALAAGLGGVLLLSAAATAEEAERRVSRIAVQIAGSGSGKIVSTPDGINCPSQCIANAETGQAYTLTATPDEGSVFVGFGGACDSSTATTCSFIAQLNTNIYAPVFDLAPSGGNEACDKAKTKLAKAKAKLAGLKDDEASASSIKKAKGKVKKAKEKVKKAC